ncbi:MAG: PQQ-binding-like beta-propeller repeat protein [Planctomycetes bacterium]|nr:PQQ-binding-like beta-propeller repeat protein [Planctomycetota bacterium]
MSVQGHLLLHEGKLYMPGGTSVSPAVYDAATGKCLNDGAQLAQCASRMPRGWELSLLGDQVVACGKPFYGHPAYDVYDGTVFNRVFLASMKDTSIAWTADARTQRVMGFKNFDHQGLARKMANPGNRFQVNWGQIAPSTKPAWSAEFKKASAMAVCRNAVLLAAEKELVALSLADGAVLWRQPLPKPPAPWGLAVDGAGRAVVTLTDGEVLCFGPSQGT